MDRNQLVGILLILAIFAGYQLLMPKQVPQPEPTQQRQTSKPSTRAVQQAKQPLDSSAQVAATQARFGNFAALSQGQAQDVVVENKDLRITFSTQGGRVKQVLLKNYRTFGQKPLLLLDEQHSQTQLELPTPGGKVDLHQLYFQTTETGSTATGIQVTGQPRRITFRAEVAPGQSIEQTYTVPAAGFAVEYDLKLNGLTNVGKGNLRFVWMDEMQQYENDLSNNRQSATVNYLTASNTFSKTPETQNSEEVTVDEPVQWYTIKHKYFLAGFIAKNSPMPGASFKALVDPADSSVVKTAIADVQLPINDVRTGKGQYRFYFGPNDFQVIRDGIAPEFDQNVYLGYWILKPINKFFFVPVFNFLGTFISNYGWLIVALVVFVKLVLTPLTYRSYVSMAKMRVLQPEINEIRERVGEDAAKQQQETMKLYQQVGVSPLSGCVPVLATMPILLSLFQLFPNLIELRQKSFLWAPDLSTYDAFINFGVTIPFVGSHLSLFTVLMTASSMAYAYYNNQTTPTQPGPIDMKKLSYIFPLMFMFVLNSFPAGLTWYYFVSNVVTIAQQQLIRRFVNEDKIKAVLDENRKKNANGEVKKSKFQSYIQKQLQAAEEARKQADDSQKRLEQRAGKPKKPTK